MTALRSRCSGIRRATLTAMTRPRATAKADDPPRGCRTACYAADASVLRPGQEAGKRLEMAANGFRERGLESVINRQDTVSAMNA